MSNPSQEQTRVLVIDDDPRVVEVLMQTLERDGFTTNGVGSAGDGYLHYLKDDFQVLMVDEALYAVDGLRLIRLVRLLDQETTLLMISGVADLPTAVSALRIGADDYISKPFKVWDLKDRILTSINRRAIVARKEKSNGSTNGRNDENCECSLLNEIDLPNELRTHLAILLPKIEAEVVGRPGFGQAVRKLAEETARKLSVRESDLQLLGQTAELQLVGFGGQDPTLIKQAFSGPQEWRDAWRCFALESGELLISMGTGAARCGELLRSTAEMANENFQQKNGDPHTLEQILWASTYMAAAENWLMGRQKCKADPTLDSLGEIEKNAGMKLDPSVTRAFSSTPG